ncbi:MAG: hypothetical protein GX638_05120 [Crenarchaeota archaeon]|jgi:hypothetical protein|nr:hypothetical protein [Thermoproteota archaeon]NLN65077.1 hypothetical protein [Clostridiaceae bacterium]
MAEKTLSQKPTSIYDYAYSPYITYSRQEFADAYPLGTDHVVEILGITIAGELPIVGWLVSVINAFCELSNINRTKMVNEVYDAFVRHPLYSNVMVASRFDSLHKGSQGWFWTPGDDYRLLYT